MLKHFHSLATFYKKPGLADPNQLSFESPHFKNGYLDVNPVSTFLRLNIVNPSNLAAIKTNASFSQESPQWSLDGYSCCSFKNANDGNLYVKYQSSWPACRVVALNGSDEDKKNATFKMVPGLSDPAGVSIESYSNPGEYWVIGQKGAVQLTNPSTIKPGFVFEVGDPEKDSKVDMEEV